MECRNLFERFDTEGRLAWPEGAAELREIPWKRHPAFAGVELKPLVTAEQTGGQCSFHLVRVAPGSRIGMHTHPEQMETHEVIAGNGFCVSQGVKREYFPGVISILPKGQPHEVAAGTEGLYLFAKFIPALE